MTDTVIHLTSFLILCNINESEFCLDRSLDVLYLLVWSETDHKVSNGAGLGVKFEIQRRIVVLHRRGGVREFFALRTRE